MPRYFFLLTFVFVVALFIGVAKLVALRGWQRLAQYQVAQAPNWSHSVITQAKVGGIGYKNAIWAAAQAEGLSLKMVFFFRVGHPPLLIPWSVIGPVLPEQGFLRTMYTITIRTEKGESVPFRFNSEQLAKEIESWRQLTGR